MHKDRPHTLGLNLPSHLSHAVQGLCTKSACKVAKKDQQNRRLVHQVEQRPARFRMKFAQ